MTTPPRLLIVDDEALITFSMRRYFQALGFEVDCAAELTEAERLVSGQCYDVVIADLRLTGLGSVEGLDLIEFVRNRCARTRAILLTSYGSPEIEAAARQRGADAMILKPKALPDLAQVVISLLDDMERP
jgi:DNA-binding response OmpR family regulator